MSVRPRQYAEVTVAVDVPGRHQGGEAVEQFQRGEEQRTVPAPVLATALALADPATGVESS